MNTPKIYCPYDEILEIGSEKLRPNPDNPNVHDETGLERLGQIIEANGWRRPIRISKRSGFMTVGHGALLTAQKRGWTHVPVNYQDYDSAEQEYADMVADNAIAGWSQMNRELILKKLPDLNLPSLNVLGLKDFTLPELAPIDRQEDGSVFDRTHEQYTGSIIKQMVLFFKADEFPKVVQRANQKLEQMKAADYSELFVRLLDEHDRTVQASSECKVPSEEVGAA